MLLRVCLNKSLRLARFYFLDFQVRAEDIDVLVMLVYHCSESHYLLFVTTSNGSYDVQRIQKYLSERQRRYLPFCLAFTGCDTISAIAGPGKTSLFNK